MSLLPAIFAIGLLVILLARPITWWFVHQSEAHRVCSPEEVSSEIESAFVERLVFTFVASSEYLPVVFEKIHLAVDGGFSMKQVEMLAHRIDFHRAHEPRYAAYPVEFEHHSSDLEFQWIRDGADRVKMKIIAVPGLLNAARAAVSQIPAHHSK